MEKEIIDITPTWKGLSPLAIDKIKQFIPVDDDSRVAFIDMMHGHIGNEIYKENNDA